MGIFAHSLKRFCTPKQIGRNNHKRASILTHPQKTSQNLPYQEFHLLCSHVKNLSLFHGTEPVEYNKNVRVVEPVSPTKNILCTSWS